MQYLLIQSFWNTVLVQSNPSQPIAASAVYLSVLVDMDFDKKRKKEDSCWRIKMLQPSLPSHSYVGLGTGTQRQGWSRKGREL